MNWTEEEYAEYLAKRGNKRQPPQKPAGEGDIVISYVIPVAPVTKKNHGRIVSFGKSCPYCGKREFVKLLPSKQYEEYKKDVSKYLKELYRLTGTLTVPVNLKCLFYTKTKRQSDLAGHLQSIQDLLVDHKVLDEDWRDIVASVDGSEVLYDKDNPRTEITVTLRPGYEQWSDKYKPKGSI